ncbi:MAG: ABC transporter ATP-binding protein [Cyclobacteriaceae bacterium]
MSETVIKIENLSKLYRLGEVGTGSFAHDLNRWWQTKVRRKEDPYTRIGSKNDRTKKAVKGEHVWALQDINFEVKQGEVIGIIGKNGAGKSTLLKLLSRVTAPTTGSIKTKGRIASLLEVGTGFHPEMTGRENIFMNGTIMGMNRHEIRAKLDEIVEFAGVAKYLDTPTKRYSSGMTVRLGFAVAAFLEPEILIVDEVLAVGDLEFQKKAINKMAEISKSNRTILFVSHNMSSIRNLCQEGVLIENGSIKSTGRVDHIISEYITNNNNSDSSSDLASIHRDQGEGNLIFESLEFVDLPVVNGKKLKFQIRLKSMVAKKNYKELDIGIAINDMYNNCINHLSNRFIYKELTHDNDHAVYEVTVDNYLKPGEYNLTLFLRTKDTVQDFLENVVNFSVEDSNPYGYHDSQQIKGSIYPHFEINKL